MAVPVKDNASISKWAVGVALVALVFAGLSIMRSEQALSNAAYVHRLVKDMEQTQQSGMVMLAERVRQTEQRLGIAPASPQTGAPTPSQGRPFGAPFSTPSEFAPSSL